jgi:hypothetical protein
MEQSNINVLQHISHSGAQSKKREHFISVTPDISYIDILLVISYYYDEFSSVVE